MPMPWRNGASAPVTIARTPGIPRAPKFDAHDARRGNLGARQRRVQHAGAGAIDRVARAAAQLVARIAAREVHRNVRSVGHRSHRVSEGCTSESAASIMRS